MKLSEVLEEGERARPIPDCPDYYVTDRGRVISTKQGSPKVLSQWIDRNGYHSIPLYHDDGNRRNRLVHRLVLRCFKGDPPTDEHETMHLDANPSNNRPENLRWGTRQENMAMVDRSNAPKGEDAGRSKLTEADVREIRRLANEGHTQREIASRFPVTQPAVHYVLSGRSWSHIE